MDFFYKISQFLERKKVDPCCIQRNKVSKELQFIIQISLEPNLTYKIQTPTKYNISNCY